MRRVPRQIGAIRCIYRAAQPPSRAAVCSVQSRVPRPYARQEAR